MKILILGLGPIGSVYGYVFKKAGHDVTYFIREEKRSKVEETLKVKLFDIRYNKKGKSKEDEYNIELMQDREFDFIFISVSPRKVKDAVDTINKNSIKGTIVFFNCLYMEREDNIKNIENLVKEKYGTWEFNYGYSPAFTGKNKIKIEGCGLIEAVMNVKEGRIKNINIRGDYFSLKETSELENILTGLRYKKEDVEDVFKDIDIGEYILNLTNKDFISLLFN